MSHSLFYTGSKIRYKHVGREKRYQVWLGKPHGKFKARSGPTRKPKTHYPTYIRKSNPIFSPPKKVQKKEEKPKTTKFTIVQK